MINQNHTKKFESTFRERSWQYLENIEITPFGVQPKFIDKFKDFEIIFGENSTKFCHTEKFERGFKK